MKFDLPNLSTKVINLIDERTALIESELQDGVTGPQLLKLLDELADLRGHKTRIEDTNKEPVPSSGISRSASRQSLRRR